MNYSKDSSEVSLTEEKNDSNVRVDTNIKNKRQVYVWPENKAFWDNLPNRSKFLNKLIIKYREENEVDGRSSTE